jgi:hypothetical protein
MLMKFTTYIDTDNIAILVDGKQITVPMDETRMHVVKVHKRNKYLIAPFIVSDLGKNEYIIDERWR